MKERVMRDLDASIIAQSPTRHIYYFSGELITSSFTDNCERKQLSLEHTMWMSTVLTSQCAVYAILVYTGQETRAKLNSKSAPSKFGRFDVALNHTAKFLFLVMVVVTVWLVSVAGWD